MARLNANFSFTGSLGNISAYRRHDLDMDIARTKGGPSKNKILKSPVFATTRKYISEFSGRSTTGRLIRQALWSLKELADYNVSGPLATMLQPLHELDTENDLGKRGIPLSKNPHLLAGFNYNEKRLFDSIIRTPVQYTLSRDTLSTRVDIPVLLPELNFFVPGKFALYSFNVVLAIIPDTIYTPNGYIPAEGQIEQYYTMRKETEWFPVLNGSPATSLEIELPNKTPGQLFSVVLGIGIRFGTITTGNQVKQLKRTGSAKILAMA